MSIKPREWTPPPPVTRGTASAATDAAASEPLTLTHFLGSLPGYLVLSGAAALVFGSWFPLALAAFLFLTDDAFVTWAFGRVGVTLVPDTLGAEFVKAFVFLFGLWALLVFFVDSAPVWVATRFSPDLSWLIVGAAALLCAVAKLAAVAVVKRLLPRAGIAVAPDRQAMAVHLVLGVFIAVLLLAAALTG